MVIKVAIASKDMNYLERLASGLEKYPRLELSIFYDMSQLECACAGRRYDVFLFSPDLFVLDEQLFMEIKADLKVLLCDENDSVKDIFSNMKRIEKYQRISQIYKDLLNLYSEVCGRDTAFGDAATEIIAVYSPVGGAGKTTVALVLAMKYAKSSKRTFYINMEDMASEDCFLPQGGKKGLSDLMRFIYSDANIGMKIQGMLKSKYDNLFYIDHFSSPNDLYDMNVEDVQELLHAVQKSGLFDVVIVDMGTSLDKKSLTIFELSGHVAVVEKTDELSARKMNCFYEQHHIMKEYGSKMLRIINFDNGISNKIESALPILGKIGDIQNMDASNIIEVLANSTKTEFMKSVAVR